MFHSASLTHLLRHRRRTMASCLWPTSIPHSTLEGCPYTLELSRGPRFPEVPSSPDFSSCSYAITGTACAAGSLLRAHLISLRVRQMLRPFGTPHWRDLTRFHTRPGHTGIASRAPFHGRPTPSLSGLGRRKGLHLPAPSAAAPA